MGTSHPAAGHSLQSVCLFQVQLTSLPVLSRCLWESIVVQQLLCSSLNRSINWATERRSALLESSTYTFAKPRWEARPLCTNGPAHCLLFSSLLFSSPQHVLRAPSVSWCWTCSLGLADLEMCLRKKWISTLPCVSSSFILKTRAYAYSCTCCRRWVAHRSQEAAQTLLIWGWGWCPWCPVWSTGLLHTAVGAGWSSFRSPAGVGATI